MTTASEIQSLTNSLSFLIKLCEGKVTTIELRDESFVTGKVVSVDGFMNVTLEEVKFFDAKGNLGKFDDFFLQNRLIRTVQIPSDINMQKKVERIRSEGLWSKSGERKDNQPKLSGGRKKILSLREKRRQEDLAAAIKWKNEEKAKQETGFNPSPRLIDTVF